MSHPRECPSCSGSFEVKLVGPTKDKMLHCPYCGFKLDVPDEYEETKVEEIKTASGSTRVETRFRRRDIVPGDGGASGSKEALLAEKFQEFLSAAKNASGNQEELARIWKQMGFPGNQSKFSVTFSLGGNKKVSLGSGPGQVFESEEGESGVRLAREVVQGLIKNGTLGPEAASVFKEGFPADGLKENAEHQFTKVVSENKSWVFTKPKASDPSVTVESSRSTVIALMAGCAVLLLALLLWMMARG